LLGSLLTLQVFSPLKLKFPINHILQVSCDWIPCCDWYTPHSAGRQTALRPCPRPLPSVQARLAIPRIPATMLIMEFNNTNLHNCVKKD